MPTIGPNPHDASGSYQSRMPPMRKTLKSLRMWVLLVWGTDGSGRVSPERVMRKW